MKTIISVFISVSLLHGSMNAASVEPVKEFNHPTAGPVDNDSSLSRMLASDEAAMIRLKQKAASLKEYVRANNFNTEYSFLVDMSIPSGKNRFFVYNLKKDSIETSSLVAHGWGSSQPGNNDELVFSNVVNSCQTSLGKYKIGYAYKGVFGLAYKLHGLDSTNNRAFERAVVLHAYTGMPETEVFPESIPESAGCPMVSTSFLGSLSLYIKSAKKPILLWIYYS